MQAVIALLFGLACADPSLVMQEHSFTSIRHIDTLKTLNEAIRASSYDRSYSDSEVASNAVDWTTKVSEFADSYTTGHHWDPCNTRSKTFDQNTIKTVPILANSRCNDPYYFDGKQGTVSVNNKNWESDTSNSYYELNGTDFPDCNDDGISVYFVFDDTSNAMCFLFACLALSLFCAVSVNKPIKSSIVMQIVAFIIIPSVAAIDLNFEIADYSLPYDNSQSAYGTKSDGTLYMIGAGKTEYQKMILKWNPLVDPYSFTVIPSDTAVQCRNQCGAMIKAYDGHEYLFIIGNFLSSNVLIFNTTSETFVDHTIVAASTINGCVSTDGVSKIFFSGGYVNGWSNTQMSVLDVSTAIVSATWEALQKQSSNRWIQYCFYSNGMHYDIGGFYSRKRAGYPRHVVLKDAWKYNVSTNDWNKMDYTYAPGFCYGRAIYWSEEGLALLLGGYLGTGSSRISDLSFIFDPSTEIMTEQYELQVARWYHTLSIVDDTLYVLGGNGVTSIEYTDLYTKHPTKGPTTVAPTTKPTTEPTAAPTSDCAVCEKCTGCDESDIYNIVFVLDESGSVKSPNYEITLEFVQTLIAEDVNDNSKVAVITFSDDQETLYSLANPQNDDRVSVIAALETEKDDANYDGRTTDTLNAVIAGMDEIKDNDDISQNILILITDGKPNCGGGDAERDPDCTTNVCDHGLMSDIEDYGVTVVIIGVTAEFDSAEVSCLSSDIIEIEAYTSAYFESIQDDIRDVTCTSDDGESAAGMISDNIDAIKYMNDSVRWTHFDLIAVFTIVCICSCLFFAMGCYWGFSLSKTKKLDGVAIYDSVFSEN